MKRMLVAPMAVLAVFLMVFGSIATAENVKLELTCHSSQKAVMTEVVAAYQASHPGVEINLTLHKPGIIDPMKVLMASGLAPDVMFMGLDWHPLYEWFLPLDQVVKDMNLSRIIPAQILNRGRLDSTMYVVPYGIGLSVMAYNKNQFAEAGLAEPKRDWTWDDAIRMAKRLTQDKDGDGKINQWGLMQSEAVQHTLVYGGDFYSADGRKAQFANPATIAAIQLFADMKTGKIGIWPFNDPQASFNSGTIAISGASSQAIAAMRTLSFDWDLVTEPGLVVDGKVYHSVFSFNSNWAVSKDTKHPNEAQELVRYLLSDAVVERFSNVGQIVPAQPRQAYTFYVNNNPRGENLSAFVESVDYAHVQHLAHIFGRDINNAVLTEANSPLWKQMWAGELPASQVLPELQRQANVILDERFKTMFGK